MEMREDDEMGGYGAGMLFRFVKWQSPGSAPSFPGFAGSTRWRTARFCLPNGLEIIREEHTEWAAYHVRVVLRSQEYHLDGWLAGVWCEEPAQSEFRWPERRLTALRLHHPRFGGDRQGFKRFATLQILMHEPPRPT